jgi:DNA-binding MarR family transcriptional regulator
MTGDDDSAPDGTEWASTPAGGDGEVLDRELVARSAIDGIPVAIAPFDDAPLEVLLPRVGAAVARHHRRIAARHRLTPTAVAVLAALEPGDLPSHRDLAARIGLSPATLTYVLDRLEETGDVRRERNLVDRRVVHVHRTVTGGARLVDARQPDGGLPRLAPATEEAVRRWLLAVFSAAEADA